MKSLRPRVVRLAALAACVLAAVACNGASTSKVSESVPKASAPGAALVAEQKKKVLGTPQPKLPVGTVLLEAPPREPVRVQVEVASTDAQRQMGLMFRESLGENEGMLFLFPTERHNSFWMHNTLIPLDMLFIDMDWKVVGVVERTEPLTDDPRAVPKMSQYVLELNGGFAARHGLGPDTLVRFTPPAGINP
jgi:uncharacterized membrane protein (UPF0127 family)